MMSDVLQQQTPPTATTVANGGHPEGGLSPAGGVASSGGRGASLERLKKRMSDYRDRQKDLLPKHESSTFVFNSQHKKDTGDLKRKFMEATKAKKANKKAEAKANMKPQGPNGLKRPAAIGKIAGKTVKFQQTFKPKQSNVKQKQSVFRQKQSNFKQNNQILSINNQISR